MAPDRSRSFRKAVFVACCVFLILLVYSTFIEPQWITVNYVNVDAPRLNHALAGTRIVVIGDFHTSGFGRPELQMLDAVAELDPDYVLVTGDIFPHKVASREALDVFNSIEARLGVWAVMGDSDVEVEELFKPCFICPDRQMRAGQASFLRDSWTVIRGPGGDVTLAGIRGDYPPDAGAFLDSIPTQRPVILLAHYPEVFDQAAARGIDLTISGDTHGGQIELPHFMLKWIFGPSKTDHRQGLFRKGDGILYVNQGIGTSVLPMRFLCRPEVTVLDF